MTTLRVGPATVVSISYSIKDDQGQLLEYRDLPVDYVQGGKSELFPQLEASLEGHQIGDSIAVDLTAEDGFGMHDPGLTFTDSIHNVPEELRQLGMEFEAENSDGKIMHFHVVDITADSLTVDANHPLAGKDIHYEVTVKAIRPATTQEIVTGEIEQISPLLQ